MKEKGEVEQAMEDMDEEEEDLLEDRTAKLEEQQELLDEIQRNRQRANGYLDDDLVNRSVLRVLRNQTRNFFFIPVTKRTSNGTDTLSTLPVPLNSLSNNNRSNLLFVRNIEFGILSPNIYKRLK